MNGAGIAACAALLLLSGCDDSNPRGSSAGVDGAASAAVSGGEAPRSSGVASQQASATPRVFAPSPAELLKRAPSVLGVTLGTSKQRLEATLGPCEALEAGGCQYWSRGVEFELAGERVQRAIAHAAGDKSALRSAADPGQGSFKAFTGDIGGVRVGLTLQALSSALSEPTQRLRAVPNAADPAGDAVVLEYAEHGLAVELSAESTVARVHVPIAPARSPKPANQP